MFSWLGRLSHGRVMLYLAVSTVGTGNQASFEVLRDWTNSFRDAVVNECMVVEVVV